MGQNRIKDLLCQESIYDNDTKIFMPGKAVTCKSKQCEWVKNWVFLKTFTPSHQYSEVFVQKNLNPSFNSKGIYSILKAPRQSPRA